MARPRVVAPITEVVRTVVRGPEPIGLAAVASIDALYTAPMAGLGEHPTLAVNYRYAGELGPHQAFRGAAPFIGADASRVRSGFNQALPSTHGPVVQPSPMLDLLGRAGA